MIGLLIRLPLVLAILIPLTWGAVLIQGRDDLAILGSILSGLEAAYPSRGDRDRMVREGVRTVSSLPSGLQNLGGGHSRLIHAGLVASAIHLEVALRILPVTLLVALCGGCAGLAFRERMRVSVGYASPTAAGLGRGVVGAGILWLVLFGLSPLPVSFAWVYVSPAAIALGGTLYVANLPLKL